MDDLEFRRRCYADPHDKSVEFLQKQQADAEAAQLATELQQLDKQLHNALQVPVPKGLAARITLRQTLENHQRRKVRQRRWGLALAACIVLLVSVGSWRVWVWEPTLSTAPHLSTLVLQHIRQEPHALLAEQQVSAERIQTLLSNFGGRLQQELQNVSYAGLCIIYQELGMHLVLDGQQGKVTVLLIPEVTVSQVEWVQDSDFAGLILPMSRGGIAIIGEKTEPLQLIAAQVQESIRFVN